jgi:cobalt-zinc-cadmium resistance protein CzcA
MLNRIIRFSINHRWLILVAVLLLAILGVYKATQLAIDAVPDITNVQVQINTEVPGYTPLEVEQRITYPIEVAMSGVPKLDYTRSLSRYGLSQITVVFQEGTDIYFARQQIAERLQAIHQSLPENAQPMMGPITTGLGEIYMYRLETTQPEKYTLLKLRTLQDWVIRPQLRNITGVAEVNAIGGFNKQYQVAPDLTKLLQSGLTLKDVENALKQNNDNIGAGYIEKQGQQYLLRAPGQLHSMHDIERVVIKTKKGVPIRVGDIAEVGIGHELRQGAGLAEGKETVIVTVSMLMGENSRVVSQAVNKKLAVINQSLPKGVKAVPVYNRTYLINETISTVKKNLIEGALLVIVVLFIFLGNMRAAIITAAVIPLTMLMTITGMVSQSISANLMSLGALDFGLIVDGAVIIVENCMKRLGQQQQRIGRKLSLKEKLTLTQTSATEVIRPSLFGVTIIMLVYIPILTLQGVEGKLFQPMAQTVIIALASSILLCLTFIPASLAVFLSGRLDIHRNRLLGWLRSVYHPILSLSIRQGKWISLSAILLVLASFFLMMRMGAEFIPTLDEGDIALHAIRIPSTSLSQSITMQKKVEHRLQTFPQVKRVFSKIGTSDIATDPMPPNVADTFVILKPRNEWPNKSLSKSLLIEDMQKALAQELGHQYEFTQPIQMRFNELLSGVRADVAIKVYGDDLQLLLNKAQAILAVVQKIPGAVDSRIEQVAGLPTLNITIDRNSLALYGLQIATVQDAIQASLGGTITGVVYEGDKRFDLVVRLPEQHRSDPSVLNRIYIELPPRPNHIKHMIPLSEVASLIEKEGPNQISRENGKRRIIISTNVRGQDLQAFVTDTQKAIQSQIQLPEGYWIEYGGQFEHLTSATKRLAIIIPITLVMIFILLFSALGNTRDSLLVFTGIPLALSGGVITLWLREIPLSISAAIGFIALSGIAVLNGLVMISFIAQLRRQNHTLVYATIRGAATRLRPVLMTALVAALGFLPMALSMGMGAEVQRPLATVVIGGLISSTLLTLIVLPSWYLAIHRSKQEIKGQLAAP